MGPTLRALLLVAPVAFAANAPRFTFTDYGGRAAVAVDAQGNTYLAGFTPGSAVAATPGAYQSQNNAGDTCPYGTGFGPPISGPCNNSWIIKLNPAGAVVFATYLGGTGDARALAIAVDSQQNVYVAGTFNVGTGNFPVTPGAAYSTGESFIAKLNPAGSQLLYSTLLPGTEVSSIVLNQDGSVLFTGTGDTTFPATPGAYQTSFPQNFGGFQVVAGKLSPGGSSLTWATFISGDLGPATPAAISLDPSENVLVAGTGAGATGDYPDQSAFLYRLNPDGSNLLSSAMFGTGDVIAMKAAPAGDIYVACYATGPGFSSTLPGFGVPAPVPLTTGVTPNYLLHVAADGVTVLNSIYLPFFLPGSEGLDVDSAGNAYLAGTISGPPLVTATPGAFQSTYGGGPSDSVLSKIAPDGEILGTTYWGGSYDSAISMAAERDGSVVLLGVQYATPGSPGNFFAANLFPAITLENSASFVANTVSPGELVSLQGYGIGPSTPGLSGRGIFLIISKRPSATRRPSRSMPRRPGKSPAKPPRRCRSFTTARKSAA